MVKNDKLVISNLASPRLGITGLISKDIIFSKQFYFDFSEEIAQRLQAAEENLAAREQQQQERAQQRQQQQQQQQQQRERTRERSRGQSSQQPQQHPRDSRSRNVSRTFSFFYDLSKH